MRAVRLVGAVLLLPALTVAGCVGERPAVDPPATVPATGPGTGAATGQPPGAGAVGLPAGPLRTLVPAPAEVPAGLVPLLHVSGPRDAAAVAAFSADPDAAAAILAANGFSDAYQVQYASPTDARSLTVVVVRFATADGARADLESDLRASTGDVVATPAIGEASEVRRLALPGDTADELVTVRFRAGLTTWLFAWRAPRPADPEVPVGLARAVLGRV